MLLAVLWFVAATTSGIAQKMLLVEKYGSPHSRKFFPGDEIAFQLTGEKEWRRATITDLIPKDSIIVFDRLYMKTANITAIKRFQHRNWSSKVGNQLYVFGATWTIFTAIDELASPNHAADWQAAAWVTGSSLISGYLLKTIFKSKVYPLGKKRRLRILDATPITD